MIVPLRRRLVNRLGRAVAACALGTAALPRAVCATTAPAAPPPSWREHTIASALLKEDRRLLVALPAGYATDRRSYPVLWLLDADDREQFDAAVANIAFLAARGAIPPLIVAGVANGSDRTRDLTPAPDATMRAINPTAGDMDRFLDFIEHEAKPVVATAYRTAPYTVLAGHSFGGLTGMNVAGRRPTMAQAVIAMSPSLWFNNRALIGPWSAAIASRRTPLRLFSTRGGNEPLIDGSAGRFERRLDSLLARRSRATVHFGHRRYPDDPHSLTPLQSLTDGLRFVFASYSMAVTDIDRLPDPYQADSTQWVRVMRGVEQQWARRQRDFPAAAVGEDTTDRALPESYFEVAPLLATINAGAGLAMARRAVALRPRSATALRLLGQVHAVRGDTLLARTRLTEALAHARASGDSAAVTAAEGALRTLSSAPGGGPGRP